MCLAIPGRVVEWLELEPPFRRAAVDFGGIRRQVSMECVPEAATGDYVLVHAGIAISRVGLEEAERIWRAIEELELADDELGPEAAPEDRDGAP